jgi:hypothetical protein
MRDASPATRFLYGMLAGVLMLVSSAFFLRDSFRLVRHGIHGNGAILRMETRGSGRHRHQVAIVHVYSPTVSGQCEMPAGNHGPGQVIPVLFLPHDPAVCRRDSLGGLFGAPGIAFVVASIVVLGSLAGYERARRAANV